MYARNENRSIANCKSNHCKKSYSRHIGAGTVNLAPDTEPQGGTLVRNGRNSLRPLTSIKTHPHRRALRGAEG